MRTFRRSVIGAEALAFHASLGVGLGLGTVSAHTSGLDDEPVSYLQVGRFCCGEPKEEVCHCLTVVATSNGLDPFGGCETSYRESGIELDSPSLGGGFDLVRYWDELCHDRELALAKDGRSSELGGEQAAEELDSRGGSV
jgi:hypothetical protein